MAQFVYSWMGSPLHFVLEEELANAYNRAQEAFFEAQQHFKLKNGTEWTGREMIEMDWTSEEQKAWNAIASVINLLIKINGGGLDIPEEQCTTDFLVKL